MTPPNQDEQDRDWLRGLRGETGDSGDCREGLALRRALLMQEAAQQADEAFGPERQRLFAARLEAATPSAAPLQRARSEPGARRWRRLKPSLAAAASIALLAVGITWLLPGQRPMRDADPATQLRGGGQGPELHVADPLATAQALSAALAALGVAAVYAPEEGAIHFAALLPPTLTAESRAALSQLLAQYELSLPAGERLELRLLQQKSAPGG